MKYPFVSNSVLSRNGKMYTQKTNNYRGGFYGFDEMEK